jgi:CubicO group peptidase (beta-lactamase class C family)
MAWGTGFQIDSPARRYLTPHGFGHDGAGGQVTFAEPQLRLSFAFVTNQMEEADPRAQALVDALRTVPEIRRRIESCLVS